MSEPLPLDDTQVDPASVDTKTPELVVATNVLESQGATLRSRTSASSVKT